MRPMFLIAAVLTAVLLAAGTQAGKKIAEHQLTNPDGFFNSTPDGWGWLPDVAMDDGGNVCQFLFTRGADSNITELAYKAMDKKGRVYSEGTIPDAVGMATVQLPTSVANQRGGFSKKLLMMGFQRSNGVDYVLYKLGKGGAEKVAAKSFDVDPGGFAVAWMYKGKIVTERGTPVTVNDEADLMTQKTEFDIAFYNKKFKQSKKGGTFVADMSMLLGKKGVVAITEGADPNELTVRIYAP